MKNVLNVMMPRQFCENISSAASSILSFVSLAKLSSIHSRVTFRSLIIVNERSLVKTYANILIDPNASAISGSLPGGCGHPRRFRRKHRRCPHQSMRSRATQPRMMALENPVVKSLPAFHDAECFLSLVLFHSPMSPLLVFEAHNQIDTPYCAFPALFDILSRLETAFVSDKPTLSMHKMRCPNQARSVSVIFHVVCFSLLYKPGSRCAARPQDLP